MLGAVVVVVAMLIASLSNQGPDWGVTVSWADAWLDRWRAERMACRVLPESSSGSALDSYAAAARAAAGADAGTLRRLRDAALPLHLTPAEGALLASLAPVVAALQQAARQPGFGAAVATGPRLEVLELMQASDELEVHWKVLAGSDPRAAFEVVLVGLQVGADLVQSPHIMESMIGRVIVGRWVAACADDMVRQLPPADLERLVAALLQVDRSMLATADPAAHVCFDLVESLRPATALAGTRFGPLVHLRAWRYGGSILELARAQAAELVALVTAQGPAGQSTMPATSTAWPAVRARLAALDTQFAKLDSIGGGHGRLVEIEHAHREVLAELRLLRLAVAFHARLDLPGLGDPFGTRPLVARVEGDTATFTSCEQGLERQVRRAAR